MASIITPLYFKGKISIPNTPEGMQTLLADYIRIAEKKYLYLALGQNLANAFLTGIAAVTIEQKWKDLLEGKTYNVTEDGFTHEVKWNGLKNTDLISMLAYFTYFDLVAENFQSAGIGTAMFQSTAENAINVSPKAKLVSVFNEGLDLYGAMPACYSIDTNIGTMVVTRPQLNFEKYWYLEPSLFNFIYFANLADATTYPNWIFTGLTRKNIVF